MPTIEKDGTIIAAVHPDILEDWLTENDLSADDVTITWSDDETRVRKRARIAEDAGDTLSLLGTTSDGALLLLIHMARFATGREGRAQSRRRQGRRHTLRRSHGSRIWPSSMPTSPRPNCPTPSSRAAKRQHSLRSKPVRRPSPMRSTRRRPTDVRIQGHRHRRL